MITLKTKIASLKMEDGEVLNIGKWVMAHYEADGTVTVEIDRDAMKADGYTIVDRADYQWTGQRTLEAQFMNLPHNPTTCPACQLNPPGDPWRGNFLGGLFG